MQGKKEKGGKKGKARKSKGKTGYRPPMKTSSNVAGTARSTESVSVHTGCHTAKQ